MSIFDKFLRIRELGIFSIIIIVVIAASIIDTRFLTIDSWRAVLLAIPLILVMAMGQMMVIICRHVDISIGSILAFAAITIGFVFIHYPETSLWMALLITAFVGLIMGLINGIIITRFNVHSIIVTLGTLSLYRGLVFIVSGGRQIDRNDIPVHIISFSQTSFFFSIPAILIFSVIIVLISHLIMRHSVLGREIYATGSNPEAAHLKGINVTKITLFCFGVCGMLAGVAGLFYASRFGYVN
ncbi:MAG: ABC transporter permease, partial [Pelagibacteraceae bacterium]|nr:ABC transporter permease [Pelagibacteraceae bacterium]